MSNNELNAIDRFAILEQLNLYQRRIDTPWGSASAQHYVDLYWPEGKFYVYDLREAVFAGPAGLKEMFDFAHSVFPMEKWFHSMGVSEITGTGDEAAASWRWTVSWKTDHVGTVSTGTYEDRFQWRDGIWKCLERASRTDPNWPIELFQPYIDASKRRFRPS
jgi:hypothetical protein